MAWFALHSAQVLFTLASDLFNFGLVTLRLAQNLFTLAKDLFNLAKALFTLAGALFNFGLVCLAFSPGRVYFGQGLV